MFRARPCARSPARWAVGVTATLMGLVVSAVPGGAAQAEAVIALAAPETGKASEAARALRKSAEETIARFNAAGGIGGETVRLVTVDDQCSEAGAAGVAQMLVREAPQLVVGHPCEKASLAAAGIYGRASLLYIATSNRHPALTGRRAGKSIFRLSGREDRQGEAAGAWLAATAPSGRIAIVQDRTAYARGLMAGATAVLKARGLPAPLVFPIVASEKSYAPVIAGITAAKSEAVFFAGYPAEAVIILDGLRQAGFAAHFLGCDSLAAPGFADTRHAKTGSVHVLMRPVQAINGAETPVPAHGGAAAGPYGEAVARAITLWAEAVRRAGGFDTQRVAAELQTGAFEGSNGRPLTFDVNGDASVAGFFAAQWDGAQWRIARDP